MQFQATERAALFIDGANLYAGSRSLGFDIDFVKLRAHFANQGQLVGAMYYTLLSNEPEFRPLRSLVDWLSYNGFTVVTKQPRSFSDAEGRLKMKNGIGVDLAVDAMRLAPQLDHLVLVSGDGDYRRLIEDLQYEGKRITVVSSAVSQPPLVSDELRRQADYFVELADLKKLIARTETARRRVETSSPI